MNLLKLLLINEATFNHIGLDRHLKKYIYIYYLVYNAR